ncbi:MAG: HD domain-containing protein [Proteobacteria bacterium]|nr:HD domain-containing protein [Pseudomonadota bacterium]
MNNKSVQIAFSLLLLFIAGSIWLVFQYVAAERQRDLDAWQSRLNIMAESQQHTVEKWFGRQRGDLDTLANNPLVQLYVSEVSSGGAGDDETSRGQMHHLKNLLNATADKAGVFTPASSIKSNQANNINDGLAIMNESGVLLATRYFPVDDEVVKQAYAQAIKTKAAHISNIYDAGPDSGAGEGGPQPRLIVAVPVSSVQSLSGDDIRAAVVAVINPEKNLYPLLAKDWLATETEETLLIAIDGNQVSYLSPLKRSVALFHRQPATGIAEAEAVKDAGVFAAFADYRGIDVLATARPIKHTQMRLVQKIDVREALAESSTHQRFILTVFLLAVFVITLSFIAIWRHATSLRLEKAKSRLEARAALLNAVGDSINDHMFLLDHDDKLVFINDALATSFAIDNKDIRGKALNHIFKQEITRQLLDVQAQAGGPDGNGEVRNREMRLDFNGVRHDYHVSIVALNHAAYKRSHLYVMHDITRLKDTMGRHNRLMDGIIITLARLIDRHDPHCAHHSERTREVAIEVARAMGLPQERIDALAMAALLANIGKLFIPAEKLTSVETLTDEETALLKESTSYSVDILKDLEFDGPVIEFVRQKNESLDGSGYPQGVSGEDILQESRILSVANAFVAMTSSRAYRSGMPIREVLDVLMSEADSRYDRHVIAALFHVAENRSDWVSWQQVD